MSRRVAARADCPYRRGGPDDRYRSVSQQRRQARAWNVMTPKLPQCFSSPSDYLRQSSVLASAARLFDDGEGRSARSDEWSGGKP